MKKEIEHAKQTREMIRIKTRHVDESVFNGIVLDEKRLFIVLQRFTDFEEDGIIILPKKCIKSIRNGNFEKCENEIIRFMGGLDHFPEPEWYLDLRTVREIIDYLKAENIWPVVQMTSKSDSWPLYVGPITEVSKHFFKLYCYNAFGEWEKEYELDYQDIFDIEINSKYGRHFNKYMRVKGMPVPTQPPATKS